MAPRSAFSVLYCSFFVPRPEQARTVAMRMSVVARLTLKEPFPNDRVRLRKGIVEAREVYCECRTRDAGHRTSSFCYAPPSMALFSSKEVTPPRPAGTDPQPAFHGTFLGPNVTVEGTVSGSETMLIEGSVRGKINLTSDLRVGTKARIEATMHAKNVTVEGKVTGDISADERVELVMTATVDGNIKAPKIIVAEGAKFRGSVDMGSHKPAAGDTNSRKEVR